jgi:beta-phosphoglucomutase
MKKNIIQCKTLFKEVMDKKILKIISDAKGYIFDMDGTLAQSQKFHYRAYNKILKEFGIIYSEEEDQNIYAGQGSEVILPKIFKINKINLPQETIRELVKEKRRIYDQLIENNRIEIIDGIRDFLKYAKQNKIKVIIATGNRPAIAKRIIQKTKLHYYFDEIITNSHVDNPKPAPDIFFYAAKKIGLRNHNCVVFEDSPHVIEGIKKHNITCVGITSSNSKKMLKAAGADIIIKDYYELLNKLTPSHAAKNIFQTNHQEKPTHKKKFGRASTQMVR